jgi:hypothetical protein
MHITAAGRHFHGTVFFLRVTHHASFGRFGSISRTRCAAANTSPTVTTGSRFFAVVTNAESNMIYVVMSPAPRPHLLFGRAQSALVAATVQGLRLEDGIHNWRPPSAKKTAGHDRFPLRFAHQ